MLSPTFAFELLGMHGQCFSSDSAKNVTTGSTLISFCAYMLTRLTGTNNELKAKSNHTRCLYKQLDSVNCKEH